MTWTVEVLNATVRAPLLEGVFGHPVPLEGGAVVTADERYIRDSILLPMSQVLGWFSGSLYSTVGAAGGCVA